MNNIAMFLNGPKAGESIKLTEPIPAKVVVATMINMCSHRPETANPTLHIEYDVMTTDSGLHTLVTEDDVIGHAYYCMECKAEREARYKLTKIKELVDRLLGYDEDDDDDL